MSDTQGYKKPTVVTSISYDARSAAMTALYAREAQLQKNLEILGAPELAAYWKTELKIARDALAELERA